MNTRKYSNKQEKTISKHLNGRQQINSGATPFYKADVITKYLLIEAKTTTTKKESFAIKKEWITKLNREKLSMRKDYGVLAFNYEPNGENYYVVNEDFIKEFVAMKEMELEK